MGEVADPAQQAAGDAGGAARAGGDLAGAVTAALPGLTHPALISGVDKARYKLQFDVYEKSHEGVTINFNPFKATEYSFELLVQQPNDVGEFEDDYGIRYTISDREWHQQPESRYRVVRWGAMEFLRLSQRNRSRRLMIEQLLLLLLLVAARVNHNAFLCVVVK